MFLVSYTFYKSILSSLIFRLTCKILATLKKYTTNINQRWKIVPKPSFALKNEKSIIFRFFLYIIFLSPTLLICPSFLVRILIIFELLAEKHIFHKCVPVTSAICKISTKIENQKNKLVHSLYGLGESYKHIYLSFLCIFNEIQKI